MTKRPEELHPKPGSTLQLAPLNMHRSNAAEKAIDIWKYHFTAGLSSVNNFFPMHLWCQLIHQAATTLNLLRPARINARHSSEAQLNGNFDYNRTPLAPPGTKFLVHKTPAYRRTWDDTVSMDGIVALPLYTIVATTSMSQKLE